MTPAHHLSYQVLCTHRTGQPGDAGRRRCRLNATHWLLGPDGELVPGAYLCEDHAHECVDEYRDKLGETWAMVPLVIAYRAEEKSRTRSR
jgi:hypothetical protein